MLELWKFMDYVLYRRKSLLKPAEFCWRIDREERGVMETTDYNESMSLREFAKRVAARAGNPINERIDSSDKLTTIVSVFVPENGYIDEPVSAGGLIEFWRAYSKAIKDVS